MYLKVDDLAQETMFRPHEIRTYNNHMQFQIAFDHIVAHYRMLSSEVLGGKTLFLALSHLLLGTYFETDGQTADCGAAQVVRYCFGRRTGSGGAGATPRHRAASGVVTVHPF